MILISGGQVSLIGFIRCNIILIKSQFYEKH